MSLSGYEIVTGPAMAISVDDFVVSGSAAVSCRGRPRSAADSTFGDPAGEALVPLNRTPTARRLGLGLHRPQLRLATTA